MPIGSRDFPSASYDRWKTASPYDDEQDVEEKKCDECKKFFTVDEDNTYHENDTCSAACYLYAQLKYLKNRYGADSSLFHDMSSAVQELEDNQK